MILSDTLNQPLALAIYAILGVVFGLIYSANYFVTTFIIKSMLYRHITQVFYVLIYSVCFFVITYVFFDYSLKLYQPAVCIIFTVGTSVLLYLPVKRWKTLITAKCNNIVDKINQSKLAIKFKK